MAVRIIITPGDSMWWLLRPEFLAYVDRVVVDPADYSRVESEKSDSGYHAAVWRRLSVLNDHGLVGLSPVEIDQASVILDAEQRLQSILADQALADVFLADLIFAYKYWLEFNHQRLDALPIVDAYARCVEEHLPVWAADLDLLVSRGREALREQPKILGETARSILARVGCLREINRCQEGVAFASLRQFQPFIKYLEFPPEFPLEGRPGVFAEGGKDLASARTVNLPVDPDIGFLSHQLSKRDYWERLSALRDDHAEARSRLGDLLDTSAKVPEVLQSGCPDPKALEAYAKLDREVSEEAAAARAGSPYLEQAFYGVCLVPTLELAGVLAGKPQASTGTAMRSGYYAIQESLLDLSRIECPPRAKVWRRAGRPKRYTFWRAADY